MQVIKTNLTSPQNYFGLAADLLKENTWHASSSKEGMILLLAVMTSRSNSILAFEYCNISKHLNPPADWVNSKSQAILNPLLLNLLSSRAMLMHS